MKKETIDKLISIVGTKHVTTKQEELICYSYDATGKEYLPEAVIFPESRDDISKILRLASSEGFPVIARGAGSGFVGGSLATHGGLILSTKRLNKIGK